jgi:hypothetical protein
MTSTTRPARRSSPLLSAALAFLLVLLLGAAKARACSPPEQPPPYTAFGASLPRAGASGVPLDSAVALDLEMYGTGQPSQVTIDVFEGDSKTAVSGHAALYSWDRTFAAWRPSSPLRANTRYRVEAAVKSPVPRPALARGPEQLSFTFTTGEQRTAPIAIQGHLQVQLEPYERPDYSTCNPGLCECTPTARERGTRARIEVPAFSGGEAERGYFALVMVTADRPYDFAADDSPSKQHVFSNAGMVVQAGRAGELVAESIDDRTQSYRPCFALRVLDVAGNVHTGESVCLGGAVAPVKKLQGTDPGGIDADTRGGCHVAGRGGGGAGWALAGVVALGAILRRRRRA